MKNCDLDKNGNTVYLKYEFYYESETLIDVERKVVVFSFYKIQ